MKIPGLACTVAMMLAGGACADRVTAPATAPVATRIRDCCGEEAPQPLFVVDGRIAVVGDGTEIDPADILDVKVLRGPEAVQAYGARGTYGAVMIATRPAEAGTGGPFAGCWLANGCADVPPPPPPTRPVVAAAAPTGGIRMGCAATLGLERRPLFVVDGRACERGACRGVSPADITDIQVWTGPLAAATYGSRGASGVLFVTTRHAGARRNDPPSGLRMASDSF
jgi:TonB-dependent SusC/RagA subfamily outer membrane receptor